ncbi:MAG TPA: hypothetical protein VMR18_00560 [Candidatus Saccharimonadales bacterium]|nr:hypothetical protein [Candidatus Saccharimonadales bacterium]
MKRIYDAAFATQTNQSHHSHLGTFWWVDDNGNTGTWNRDQAYDYTAAYPETVYVSEGDASAWVYPYHYTNNPSVKWIQTEPDGKLKDNLITLAKRHAQGLVNR